MTNLSDFVTETEAAKLLGISAGKGNVWRHLRKHAPQIELKQIFGVTAVKRVDLESYRLARKVKSVDAFTHEKRRAQLRRLREAYQKRQGGISDG